MNNIQKMQNKAYKAFVKESEALKLDKNILEKMNSSKGRREVIRAIKAMSYVRVKILKKNETTYEAMRSLRDYSLKVVKERGL